MGILGLMEGWGMGWVVCDRWGCGRGDCPIDGWLVLYGLRILVVAEGRWRIRVFWILRVRFCLFLNGRLSLGGKVPLP